MHSLSFTGACCLALCLASCIILANGQYKSSPYQQRKMAPIPASYSAAPAAVGDYGEQQQQQQQYGQQMNNKYSSPSAASTSQYDERQQTASYGAPTKTGYGAPAAAPSQSYGKAKYEEPQYPPMPFAWGYDINDGYGGAQYHKENGDEYGKRTGSYGYTDAYGIYRQVDYVADEYGFRATIKTNEPGTANESPADVDLHAYEPPSNYYAGNTYQSSSPSSSYQASAAKPATPASSYGKASYQGAATGAYSVPKMQPQPHMMPVYQPAARQPTVSQYGQQQAATYNRQAGNYQQQQQQAAVYQQQQQQQQDYAGSVLVPVYQKLATPLAKKIQATRHI